MENGEANDDELISRTKPENMKFLALLLLFALAYADEEVAKPAVLYAGHYPYYGYAGLHYPYALSHPAVTYAVKPYTYYANSGGAIHIVKRDAESNPDADASPESLYAGYYGVYPTKYHYGYAGLGAYYGGYWGGYGGYYGGHYWG